MKELVRASLKMAYDALQKHVREVGHSNTGVEVNRYLKTAGVDSGNPWCAAAVYTWIDDAAKALNVSNPYLRSAYCPDIGDWARRRHILKSQPQAGDVFLQMHSNGFHHTGFVIEASNGSFRTLEGNTNSDGGREGYEVASHLRTIESRFSFVRWSDLVLDELKQTRVLKAGAHKIADLPVVGNVTLAPVRRFCKWFSMNLVYDKSEEPPFVVDGKPIGAQASIIEGEAFVPLRELVALDPTLRIAFDAPTQTISISRL